MSTAQQAADSTVSIMDSVVDTAGAINDYGIMIVICALMIVIFVLGALIFIRNYTTNAKSAVDQNNQLVQELIKENAKFRDKIMELQSCTTQTPQPQHDGEGYDKKHIVNIFVELNTVLKGTCKHLQETIGAGRVAVYVFHNGSVASHGLPFFKLSCVSEWISRGCGYNTRINVENSMPLAIFSPMVEDIMERNDAIIYSLENTKEEEPILYSWLSSNQSNICIIQGIYSGSDNTPMGFVSIEYNRDLDLDIMMSTIRPELKEACIKCAPVLEFSNVSRYGQSRI